VRGVRALSGGGAVPMLADAILTPRPHRGQRCAMKAILAALLLIAGLLCPCARAQQDDAARKKFAEKGNAVAPFDLRAWYYKGVGAESVWQCGACYYKGAGMDAFVASVADKNAAKARDDMGKTMTPQQVADAQKRAQELRAIIEANAKAKAAK
jgi:hypothetical protein